MPEEELHI